MSNPMRSSARPLRTSLLVPLILAAWASSAACNSVPVPSLSLRARYEIREVGPHCSLSKTPPSAACAVWAARQVQLPVVWVPTLPGWESKDGIRVTSLLFLPRADEIGAFETQARGGEVIELDSGAPEMM